MKKLLVLCIALLFCIAIATPASAMGGFFRDPCFDENGNRISNFGHCNDHRGGTASVPMYELEADESNAPDEPEAPDEPDEPSPPAEDEGPRGDCGGYSLK